MKNIISRTEIFRLDNGLNCYYIPRQEESKSLTVCLAVKAGAFYEEQGERGCFHFLEHLSIYPHLYPSVKATNRRYFKALDYAYTSFSETSYIFHGVDWNGELLEDSIATAKGILNGSFLTETSYERTKADVLEEYRSFQEKKWYSSCERSLNGRGMSLPVGTEKDICRANFSFLLHKHEERYQPENAALLIVTSCTFSQVHSLVESYFGKKEYGKKDYFQTGSIFERSYRESINVVQKVGKEPVILMAWLPRIKQTEQQLLKKYMCFSVMNRAFEMLLEQKTQIEKAECSVEIFQTDNYIFKLCIWTDEEKLKKLVMQTEYNTSIFEQAKDAVQKDLKQQCSEREEETLLGEMVNCCKEHFLYQEPFIAIVDEYKFCSNVISNLVFEETKELFSELRQQFADSI